MDCGAPVTTGSGARCRPCHYASRLTSIEQRFWAKVSIPEGQNGCWLWLAGTSPMGYGRIQLPRAGGVIFAHRMSWILTKGPIPEGMFVCHHCDNPPCVNPTHLFLGTARDNIRDCITKGRFKFLRPSLGVTNCNAKLTPERVIELRHRYARGETLSSLSRSFKMARSSLRWAVNGRSWKAVSV